MISQQTNKERLKQLSIADLVVLHDNYWMVDNLRAGARFRLLDKKSFEEVEQELADRLNVIFQ